MFERLIRLLHTGTSLTSSPSLKRKILHCNISVVIAFWTLLFFLVIYTLTGDPALRRVVYFEMPFLVLYLAPIWLNNLGRYLQASWALMILLMISMAISIHAGVGTEFNIHLYYLLFAVAPISLFPRKHWKSALLLCLLNTLIYLYYFTHPMVSPPSFQPLDHQWKNLIITCVSMSVAFTTFFLFWLSDSIAEQNEADIQKMAMTDPLTQLPNRRAFEIVLRQEVAHYSRSGEPLALVMLDIDHFKRVNDTYGHDVGDGVLQHVAKMLLSSVRSGNMIARVGGEEFCMLLCNTSLTHAVEVTERMRRLIEESPYHYNDQELSITISAGVCLVNVRETVEAAYRTADEALYRAKRNGRNRVEVG